MPKLYNVWVNPKDLSGRILARRHEPKPSHIPASFVILFSPLLTDEERSNFC